MFAAALLFAAITSQAETSRQLTASAEELLRIEKRIAAENDLDSVLYEDVLSLLDSAIEADPDNLHAHALAASVLLLKSDDGDGTFDVCVLLDARDEANQVLAHSSRASAADAATAATVAWYNMQPRGVSENLTIWPDNWRERLVMARHVLWHSPDDEFELVDKSALDRTEEFVWEVMRRLDGERS